MQLSYFSSSKERTVNRLTKSWYRMSSLVTCASVVWGALSFTPTVIAAQVRVNAVIDRYTGPSSTAGDVNGTFFPGGNVTDFTWPLPSNQALFSDGFLPKNLLRFESSGNQNAAVGDEFLWGTITYSNGDWYPGTSSFHIRFTSASIISTLNGHVFDDYITLVVTPNNFTTQTPLQNADFVYLTSRPDLGSIRVFEGADSNNNNTGIVSIFGRIGSLIPTRFANATGGATIVNSIDPLLAPEPSVIVLFAAGLGLLLLFARRRVHGSGGTQ